MGSESWPAVSPSSSVQPPWEREPSSPPNASPMYSPAHSGDNGYLYAASPLPTPMQLAYGRTGSFSASPSDHSHSQQPCRSSFFSEEGGRRQSLSGPLPSQGEASLQKLLVRRSSLSGPLSPSNPYLTSASISPESLLGHTLVDLGGSPANSESIPPLKTPPPWSELRQGEAGWTNPYLNPQIYSMTAAATLSPGGLSSNGASTPSSLNPSPSFRAHGMSPSSSSRNLPSSSLSGNEDTYCAQLEQKRAHAGHRDVARQLYSHTQREGSISSALNGPSAATSLNHWSSPSNSLGTANNTSQISMEGPGSVSTLQGSGIPSSPSALWDVEVNGAPQHRESRGLTTPASLPKSKKPPNGVMGRSASTKILDGSRAPSAGLARSMSFESVVNDGTKSGLQYHYTKARSLVDGVVENLVGQLLCGQDRPNLLAGMIFSSSKVSKAEALASPFASARLLVERILLVQLRALTPRFTGIASQAAEFEKQTWALKGYNKNGDSQEDFSNEGLRLLRLQKGFVENGVGTFDVLCKLRDRFPHFASENSNDSGLLRIACIGGGPGSSAVALLLFFLRLCPSLKVEVDIQAGDENWKEIVDAVSLKAIGFDAMDVFELIKHPSLLRSYKVVAFVDILGERMKTAGLMGQWQDFWNKLFQNTNATVLIIIYDTSCRWEEMIPNKGQWWCSSVPNQDSVHIVRKI